MDSEYKFWATVNFLTNNSDSASYIDIHEREMLSKAIELARKSNRLTGIPTQCFKFVISLAETVKERIKKSQRKIEN